jgi:hypothetical protein
MYDDKRAYYSGHSSLESLASRNPAGEKIGSRA